MDRPVTNMDILDQMKRVIDGQIGEAIANNNKEAIFTLTNQKRILLDEIDIPEYNEARLLFSGVKNLEDAAQFGRNYSKLSASELKAVTGNLLPQEFDMFVLGVKESLLLKIENMQSYADVGRLFTRNGDAGKLRDVFGQERYNAFKTNLSREAQFKMTQRGIEGNSSSVKQLLDISADDNLDMPVTSVTGNAFNLARRLFKKKSADVERKLHQEIGYFLSEQGLDPVEFAAYLKPGYDRRLANMLITVGRTKSGEALEVKMSQLTSLNPNPQLMPAIASTIPESIPRYIPQQDQQQDQQRQLNDAQRRLMQGFGL